jgi:hypothetical protein
MSLQAEYDAALEVSITASTPTAVQLQHDAAQPGYYPDGHTFAFSSISSPVEPGLSAAVPVMAKASKRVKMLKRKLQMLKLEVDKHEKREAAVINTVHVLGAAVQLGQAGVDQARAAIIERGGDTTAALQELDAYSDLLKVSRPDTHFGKAC